MINIVELDLETVKQYLRVDHNDDDILLATFLSAAKGYIQNYLNQRFVDMEEIPAELTIPALALVSHFYEQRQIVTDGKSREVLYTFSSILNMHRRFYGGELI